jgi:hypothetical protein
VWSSDPIDVSGNVRGGEFSPPSFIEFAYLTLAERLLTVPANESYYQKS